MDEIGPMRRFLLEGDVTKTTLTVMCAICIFMAAVGVICKYIGRSWVQTSTAYILAGGVCGGLLRIEYGEYAQQRLADGLVFDDDFYFRVLLPLVVLDAGLNLERENVDFWGNITPIVIFTVAGTFFSALIIGFGTWGLGALAEATWGEPLNGTVIFSDPIESLKFGALISPTDPVAILSVLGSLGPLKDKALFSIIFGESVLNDAIGIVAFEVFEDLDDTRDDDDEIWQIQVIEACGWFVVICVASVALGIICGLLAARLTKIWPAGEDISHYEVTVVFFSCYGAYLLAESLNELTDAPGPFSGLFTLFTATLVAGHYTMHNISPEALTASNYGFRTVAWLSEAVIFFYLGVEVLLVPFGGWDFGFIFLVTALGFIGRTLVVAALSAGLNCTAGPMCGCTTVRPRIGARSQVCVCMCRPPCTVSRCHLRPPADHTLTRLLMLLPRGYCTMANNHCLAKIVCLGAGGVAWWHCVCFGAALGQRQHAHCADRDTHDGSDPPHSLWGGLRGGLNHWPSGAARDPGGRRPGWGERTPSQNEGAVGGGGRDCEQGSRGVRHLGSLG